VPPGDPVILCDAAAAAKPGGGLAVIRWRYTTGPAMSIAVGPPPIAAAVHALLPPALI